MLLSDEKVFDYVIILSCCAAVHITFFLRTESSPPRNFTNPPLD